MPACLPAPLAHSCCRLDPHPTLSRRAVIAATVEWVHSKEEQAAADVAAAQASAAAAGRPPPPKATIHGGTTVHGVPIDPSNPLHKVLPETDCEFCLESREKLWGMMKAMRPGGGGGSAAGSSSGGGGSVAGKVKAAAAGDGSSADGGGATAGAAAAPAVAAPAVAAPVEPAAR